MFACLDVYDPVCGVDGITYGNGCVANCQIVEIKHDGECEGMYTLQVKIIKMTKVLKKTTVNSYLWLVNK